MKITCKICNKKYVDYLLQVCKCEFKICSNCKKNHILECNYDYYNEHQKNLKKCLIKIEQNKLNKI